MGINEEIQKLKDLVQTLEDIASRKLERHLPTVKEANEMLRQHQLQAHGREDAKLSRECDKCWELEIKYHVAAKVAGALPFDPESPR